MSKQAITRELIAGRIDDLLRGDVSVPAFGNEMFMYLALDEKYVLEPGYEKVLEEILDEFMEMHDADQGDVGYEPHVPSRERLIHIRDALLSTSS